MRIDGSALVSQAMKFSPTLGSTVFACEWDMFD